MSRENKKDFISAIIACYNDELAIPVMHERLTKVFKKIDCNYEIIFVCDGSPDNSETILKDLCIKYCSQSQKLKKEIENLSKK